MEEVFRVRAEYKRGSKNNLAAWSRDAKSAAETAAAAAAKIAAWPGGNYF